MRIEDAIKELKRLQKSGVHNVLATWWTADDFGRKDDSDWSYDSAYAERHIDWSDAHEAIRELIENTEA